MLDSQRFQQFAVAARAEADAAELPNVRERALRSEAAWLSMASRSLAGEARRARLAIAVPVE